MMIFFQRVSRVDRSLLANGATLTYRLDGPICTAIGQSNHGYIVRVYRCSASYDSKTSSPNGKLVNGRGTHTAEHNRPI